MNIAEHPVIRLHFAGLTHNHWIRVGYIAFALIAVATIYFASTGSGLTEAELAMAAVWP